MQAAYGQKEHSKYISLLRRLGLNGLTALFVKILSARPKSYNPISLQDRLGNGTLVALKEKKRKWGFVNSTTV
jgi:hypothetical protein